MPDVFLVAYDGSEGAKRAAKYAANHAKSTGGSLLIAHVLEWSPYTFLTPNELEERHKRRGEELERAETALVKPLLDELSGTGVKTESVIKYGHVAETLCKIASDSGAAQIFIGRTGHSMMSTRLFGSVAGSLSQIAPVPCTIVP